MVFYDIKKNKIKSFISNLQTFFSIGPLNMISKDLLILSGVNKFYVININKYNI